MTERPMADCTHVVEGEPMWLPLGGSYDELGGKWYGAEWTCRVCWYLLTPDDLDAITARLEAEK